MLHIIGLGLNMHGITSEGFNAIKESEKIYLENYTVDFPYSIEELQKIIGKKIIPADREFIESLKIVGEAKKSKVVLLVYGSPLFATTHISLIQEAKKSKTKYKIIYSASVFDALGETGLQLYKFGKITSMPEFDSDSFVEIVKQNQGISAHSLILVDIGMEFKKSMEKLQSASKNKIKINKILVCQNLGTKNSGLYYDKIENLKNLKIKKP